MVRVKNNLYFCNLFDSELNLICKNVQKEVSYKLDEIKDNDLFYIDIYSDVYSIIPLFNVSMIEGIDENGKTVNQLDIVSTNPNDIVSDKGIICEKNSNTRLYFR